MLLLKFSSAHRQPVALVLRRIELPVRTLHFGARFIAMPTRLLELAAQRTKLEAETIRFRARLLQVLGNMRVKRHEKICPGLCQRHFAIRVRRFGHDPIRFRA